MENFDFYFAGISGSKYFSEAVRVFHHNELASFHLQRKIIDKTITNLREYRKDPEFVKTLQKDAPWMHLGVPGKLFIDSGAFSMWTKGAEVNVDDYINWLNANADCINLFGQVDKIPGKFGVKPSRDEIREAAEGTIENYFYMKERLTNPDGLLYTFHYGEPFDLLERMLKESDMKYMAFGGLVGKSSLERDLFLERAFHIVKASPNPNIKIHAFGVSDFDLLKKYPVYSSDSAAWVKMASYGSIRTQYGNIIVSEQQADRDMYYKNRFPAGQLAAVEKAVLGKYGFTFDELKNNRDKRIYYNAAFFKDEIEKMEREKHRQSRILFKKK